MRVRAMLFFIAAVGSSPALAADPSPSQSWPEVRSLYDSGRVDEAVRLLEQHPTQTPEYFFNLGTAYFRLGGYGKAVAFLEKARKLRPADEDTRRNLDLARSKLAQALGSAQRLDPGSTFLERVAETAATPEIRAALAVAALLLLSLAWREYMRQDRSISRILTDLSGWLGVAGLLILAALGVLETIRQSRPAAVCLSRITVRSGPGDRFLEMGAAETGMKLRLLGPSAHAAAGNEQGPLWFQVRYGSDGVGWVPSASLLVL